MNCSTSVSTTPKYIFILPKANFKKKMYQTKERECSKCRAWTIIKKRKTECCNNCVYSPLTVLGNKELKERKKRWFLSTPEGCLKMHKRKKRGERKIRGGNKIMNWCSKKEGALKKRALVHLCKPHSTRISTSCKVKWVFIQNYGWKCSCTLGFGCEIFRFLVSCLVCSLSVSDPPGTLDGWALWAVVHLMTYTVSRITASIASLWPRMSWRSWQPRNTLLTNWTWRSRLAIAGGSWNTWAK